MRRDEIIPDCFYVSKRYPGNVREILYRAASHVAWTDAYGAGQSLMMDFQIWAKAEAPRPDGWERPPEAEPLIKHGDDAHREVSLDSYAQSIKAYGTRRGHLLQRYLAGDETVADHIRMLLEAIETKERLRDAMSGRFRPEPAEHQTALARHAAG